MKILTRLLIGVAVTGIVLVIGAVVFFSQCWYSGAEFSPDDFSCRQFTYLKVPNSEFVLSEKVFKDYYSFQIDLVADGFITAKYSTPQAWHLFYDGNDSELRSHDCDARLLVDYLTMKTDRYEDLWVVWNSDHPQLAKEFWPIVAQMARDQAYLVIGDVMEFGLKSQTTDVDQFKDDLNKIAAAAYLKIAKVELDLDNAPVAKSFTKTSLDLFSTAEANDLLTEIDLP